MLLFRNYLQNYASNKHINVQLVDIMLIEIQSEEIYFQKICNYISSNSLKSLNIITHHSQIRLKLKIH